MIASLDADVAEDNVTLLPYRLTEQSLDQKKEPMRPNPLQRHERLDLYRGQSWANVEGTFKATVSGLSPARLQLLR